MKIGELSERTGLSARQLRYYEQQGLIAVERRANGYREYTEANVDQVKQVRDLLDAGIPVKIIKQLLPCLAEQDDIYFLSPGPEVLVLLEEQRDRMSRKAACMARNRDAITAYLERVRGGQPSE